MPHLDYDHPKNGMFQSPHSSAFPEVSHLQGKGVGNHPLNNAESVAMNSNGKSMSPPALAMQASPDYQEKKAKLLSALQENSGPADTSSGKHNFEMYKPPVSSQKAPNSSPFYGLSEEPGEQFVDLLGQYKDIMTGKLALVDEKDDTSKTKFLFGENQHGEFEEDGKTYYGSKQGVGLVKNEYDLAKKFGLEGLTLKYKENAMTLEKDAYHTDGETSFSAGGTLGGAEVEFGTNDADSDQDSTVVIGAGAGAGGGIKFIHDDFDKDGQTSYGAVLSVPGGPTIGLTSEDILKSSLDHMGNPLLGSVGDLVPDDINLTNEASDMFGELWD